MTGLTLPASTSCVKAVRASILAIYPEPIGPARAAVYDVLVLLGLVAIAIGVARLLELL